jgi:hypothetical protein
MEDSDKLSTAAKQRNVVSRRQQAAAAASQNEEMRPMLPQQQAHKPQHVSPPPRSGQSLFLPSSMLQYSVRDKTAAAAKRRYNVNIPTRMIVILVLVFMIAPLMIFFYKEFHIHDDHNEPHFKPEKFVNVDTNDVLSHLLDNKQNKNSTHIMKKESSASSGDKVGGNAGEESKPLPSSLKAAGNVTHTVGATSENKGDSKSSKEAERKRHLRQLLAS